MSSIPPVPEEPEEPEWLKARGTVKISSLPAATVPVLDATVAVATLAATLPSQIEPSPHHAWSDVGAGGFGAGFLRSPPVASIPDAAGEQMLAPPAFAAVDPDIVISAAPPVAATDAIPAVTIPSATAVVDRAATDAEPEAVADHRPGSPVPSASLLTAAPLPEDAPLPDEGPPLPQNPGRGAKSHRGFIGSSSGELHSRPQSCARGRAARLANRLCRSRGATGTAAFCVCLR